MKITAQDVKRLREVTGVGMMDCKRALQETEGDFDAAIDQLRKKGQKVAAKRADRDANEGLIVTASSDDNKTCIMAEVNCETDFVARNEDFQQFANELATLILREHPADREAFLALPFQAGRTAGEALTDATGKIGEKIDVRRFTSLTSDGGEIVAYIHPGARLGVLVDVSGNGDIQQAGRDVAMQAAALNPVALNTDEVSDDLKEKEMEIARESARNEGKPEHIIDNIAKGKLKRYYKDNVLIEQPFVKDASMTVKEMLKQADATVDRFVRYALGG